MNPTDPNKEYTVSLNLDEDDQLLVQNMNEDEDAEETAELFHKVYLDCILSENINHQEITVEIK